MHQMRMITQEKKIIVYLYLNNKKLKIKKKTVFITKKKTVIEI